MNFNVEFWKDHEKIYEARDKNGNVVKRFDKHLYPDDLRDAKAWRKNNPGYDVWEIVKEKNSGHVCEESILICWFEV